MKTEAEETMIESFRTLGKEYGYDNVNAEFVAYKDFKVKWQRSYKWADFKVSDYMLDAPREVFDGLARTLFSKISGGDIVPYSYEMCDWITNDNFVAEKQRIYLRRSRTVTKSPKGKNKDLSDSFARLQKLGLVDKDDSIFLTWTTEDLVSKVGYCSAVMKVIAISSILDDDTIPDLVLDYSVYHEYLVMMGGRKNFGTNVAIDTLEAERRYPEYRAAENWLNRLCLYLC